MVFPWCSSGKQDRTFRDWIAALPLPRESGFLGVLDLLKVAQHGKGRDIYLIRFHYIPPKRCRSEMNLREKAVRVMKRIGFEAS